MNPMGKVEGAKSENGAANANFGFKGGKFMKFMEMSGRSGRGMLMLGNIASAAEQAIDQSIEN
jgi:hypothetical protein